MTIFICSSLGDISEILFRINYQNIKEFKIIVTNYRQCHRFFLNFFDREKIIFIGSNLTREPKKIKSWIAELKILIKLFFFENKKNVKKVFFSAPLYDMVGCYLILRIFKNAKIYLPKNVYDEIDADYKEILNRTFLHSLFSFFYGIPIASYDNYRTEIFNSYIPGLPKKSIRERFELTEKIPEENLNNQTKKYLLEYNNHNIKNAIIILDHNEEGVKNITDFEDVYSRLFDILKDEKIFLKPYYANKNSPLEEFNLSLLDMEFPIEWYNLSKCKSVICVFSSGIVKIANRNISKICLINLFEFKSNKEKLGWNQYIKTRFDNRIFSTPESFEELEHLLK
tara:strand:+ start:955 stop:1974 length:1020 start_codon:yes stop_codon:yes gene_type:complete